MYANSGTTASYIKLVARFLLLNILWFLVADTRMRRSSQSIHTVIDVTLYVILSYIEYLINRIFNANRCLFAFASGACSTFNFNKKVALSAGFNTIYWSIGRGLLFWPILYWAQAAMICSSVWCALHAESELDPSAAADRRIRRPKFVRRKSAEKITARRISRRILLAVNPP